MQKIHRHALTQRRCKQLWNKCQAATGIGNFDFSHVFNVGLGDINWGIHILLSGFFMVLGRFIPRCLSAGNAML
jgi:hypothetical protein